MAGKIEALIFDVFGTLVDWRTGVADRLKKEFANKDIEADSLAFADAWRGEYQPSMEPIRSGERAYVPLDILHLENLKIVLARFGIADQFTDDELRGLSHAWENLPAWPDTSVGLKRLKRHFLIAPCSNGSIALMSRLARFASLPWDAILGADIAKTYKPAAEVYLKSAAALGLEPRQVVMVAAHNDDLRAAAECGLATAFIPRPLEYGRQNSSDAEPARDWDFVARDVEDLAERLAARA
jgi:2-haloacid dehalogenase